MGLNLSIHGRDRNTGVKASTPYNSNPKEPKAPSTARGKRRLANKTNKVGKKDKA